MFVSSRKWPQKRNVWFTWGLRPWPTWRVTRLRDRNPQSWNGSNPMVTSSKVNIGMWNLDPKTQWIDLSSWEWFLILKEWEFEFWSSLISLDYPESFIEDSPTSNLIRQILGSVSEFDKNSTVSKLRVSRVRKRESNRDKGIVTRTRKGKCEGSKRILEVHPELESLVSRLRKKGMSYRKISEFLKEEHGYSVSFKSVERILKDIDWMKKERRRMRRSETV